MRCIFISFLLILNGTMEIQSAPFKINPNDADLDRLEFSISAPVISSVSSITSTSFVLNWGSVTGATSYQLDVSTTSDFLAILPQYNNVIIYGSSTAIYNGITAGTTYYLRLRATNGSEVSINSNSVTVLTVPSAPNAFAATNLKSNSFKASWNIPSSTSVFYIDVSTDNNFSNFVEGYNNKSVGTSEDVVGLASNTTYFYRVRAKNNSGVSANSNVITAITTPSLNSWLISPNNSEIFPIGSIINVSINNSLFNPIAVSVELYKGTTLVWGPSTSGISGRTIPTTGLKAGADYKVRVYNANDVSQEDWSDDYFGIFKDQNYVKSQVITVKGTLTDTQLNTLSINNKTVKYDYFNGLGQKNQSVQKQFSPLGYDIVESFGYDAFGRENINYLPFVSVEKTGQFKDGVNNINSPGSEQTIFYNNGSTDKISDNVKPYSQIIYEQSSLNRIIRQGSAGDVWQPKGRPNVLYNAYFQKWNYSDFLQSSANGGGGYVSVDIQSNLLTIEFSSTFQSSKLTTGPIKFLNTTPALPDMDVGFIAGKHYKVSIKSSYLFIESTESINASVSGFGANGSDALFKFELNNITTGTDGFSNTYANSNQSWYYADFVTSNTGGGGSVSAIISNNILLVTFSAGFNSSTLKTGQIKLIETSPGLPDMDIGSIGGGNYKVSVKNGCLTILSATETPVPITGFDAASFKIDLSDHSIKKMYQINIHGTSADSEQIIAWSINTAGQLIRKGPGANYIEDGGYFSTGQLYINSTINEEGYEVRDYTNKEKQVVLKKVQITKNGKDLNNANYWAETYYIYDDFGNLVLVLPPEGVAKLKATID